MESVIEGFFAALPGQKRAQALRLRDIIIEVHRLSRNHGIL
jgi:hypothetical protein